MDLHLVNSETGKKVPEMDSDLSRLTERVSQIESQLQPLKDEMADTREDY